MPIQFVACDLDQEVSPYEHVIDHRIDMPTPTLDERRKLWQAHIPESAAWPVHELETLVGRYRLHGGDIVSVARRGPGAPGSRAPAHASSPGIGWASSAVTRLPVYLGRPGGAGEIARGAGGLCL